MSHVVESPVLEVRDLVVNRSGVQVLNGVSWKVMPGEHWVILGANGSGKTSLLSVLAAYMSPTSGTIKVLGHRFGETDWRELRTHLGIVSSSVRQMMADAEPALTTVISGKYAMIEYWGKVSRADQLEAGRILKLVRCSHLAERPWAVLSQGERQRVLIGRALMAKPKVLILDEPCAGLDPVARERFLQFMEQLGRSKHSPALVLVTHHIEEVMPVFTHVVALRKGKVVARGKVAEVMESATLGKVFGASMRVSQSDGRHHAVVESLPPSKK
ncbi:MAG: ABC transporter ATP-binding protein [Chthoniobacteraceae bacterium]